MLKKIVSGGQTGVDRAALDFAIAKGIEHGGWVPKGRRAEDGTIPEFYRMSELKTTDYAKRTERNILESDGTVIITRGDPRAGSALTRKLAELHQRPWIHLNMREMNIEEAAVRLHDWIIEQHILVLNVAGPRGSEDAFMYGTTRALLERTFATGRQH